MKIIRKTTLSTWIANTSTKTALHVCLFGFCDKNKVSGINLHLWHKLKFLHNARKHYSTRKNPL